MQVPELGDATRQRAGWSQAWHTGGLYHPPRQLHHFVQKCPKWVIDSAPNATYIPGMQVQVDLSEEQAAWLAEQAAKRRPARPSKAIIVAELIAREMEAQAKAACEQSIGRAK